MTHAGGIEAAGEGVDQGTPAVQVSGLRKSYGEREVVRGVDFEVHKGECFGLLGRNGAGKTTIIEICEGYVKLDEGSVLVLGEDPASPSSTWRARLGIVPQEMELLPTLTVSETIAMFRDLYPRPRDVLDVLQLVGLGERGGSRVRGLSGGEKRRLDVAVGLIGNPEVLFLDEPTTGLDPEARRSTWSMIEGLKDHGVTIILTTHYMEEAQLLADRLLILTEGQVAASGTFGELQHQHGSVSTISFRLPAGTETSGLALPALKANVTDANALEFESTDVQSDLSSLLDWARTNSVEVSGLQVARDSLEDLFLSIGQATGSGELQEATR